MCAIAIMLYASLDLLAEFVATQHYNRPVAPGVIFNDAVAAARAFPFDHNLRLGALQDTAMLCRALPPAIVRDTLAELRARDPLAPAITGGCQ